MLRTVVKGRGCGFEDEGERPLTTSLNTREDALRPRSMHKSQCRMTDLDLDLSQHGQERPARPFQDKDAITSMFRHGRSLAKPTLECFFCLHVQPHASSSSGSQLLLPPTKPRRRRQADDDEDARPAFTWRCESCGCFNVLDQVRTRS